MKARKIEMPVTIEQLESVTPEALDAQRLELQTRAEELDKQYCQALLNIQSVSDELDRLAKQLSSAKGEKVRAMATGKPVDEPEKLIETVQSKITEQSQIRDFSSAEVERLPREIENTISEMRMIEDIGNCQRQVIIGKKLQKALRDAAALMKQYHKTTAKISAENKVWYVYSVKRQGVMFRPEQNDFQMRLDRRPVSEILSYIPCVYVGDNACPQTAPEDQAKKYCFLFDADCGAESEVDTHEK